MTDILTGMLSEDDFLEHYGTKGMKWGVIRDQAAGGDKKAAKQLRKADKAWEKEITSPASVIKTHNEMARRMNGKMIDDFNNDPKYSKIKDFNDFSDPKVQEYHNDFSRLSNKVFMQAAKDIYGDSPSGRYKQEYRKDEDGEEYLQLVDTQIEHADAPKGSRLRIVRDPKTKRIIGVKMVDSAELKHSDNQKGTDMTDAAPAGMMSEEDFLAHIDATEDMTADEFLEHFGVKGMKWGKVNTRRLQGNTGPVAKVSRQEVKAINKASKAKENAELDAKIDGARARIASGENRAKYVAAKTQYKADKLVVGKREAKKAFNAVKEQNIEDYNVSQLAKSGRERTTAIITGIAGMALIVGANMLRA